MVDRGLSIRTLRYKGKLYEGLVEDEFSEQRDAEMHAKRLEQQGLASKTLVRKVSDRNTYQVYTI